MSVTEQEAAHMAEQLRRAVPGGSFILDEPDEVPALWGNGQHVLWAEGEAFMVAGHQGLGKTTLAQQLVLAMVGVAPPELLGMPVTPRAGRILYLAMDRPRQAARSFRRMVREESRDLLNDRLHVWRGPLPVDPLVKGDLLAWVHSVCADVSVVVIDSVKDLAPGVNTDEVGSAINLACQSLIADDIDVLLLHHQRKASSDSRREVTLDSIYGSTWLTSGLGSVAVLEGEPGSDEVTMHHVKQPADTVGPVDFVHDHVPGRSRLHTAPVRLSVEAALGMAETSGLTVDEIVNMTGLSSKTVRSRLRAMAERVQEVAGGHNTSGGRIAKRYRPNGS
ncbi:AAA family ATPase [Serinicoccus marinus]|uniref:AAA family ATPase n=1 Tax=Serinicoccus marinus TaxID=247333 RepID=UPI0003B6E4C1|nr:AAA family ATPase [Serinicoccus marinus]